MLAYHDEAWGRPVHDDGLLFEMLTLEGAQAGLSWATVLKRRPEYKKAFANFDISAVARFTDAQVSALVAPNAPANVIRHRGKIESTVNNAKAALKVQAEFGSLDKFFWSFVDFKPVVRARGASMSALTETSERMSKDMKARGFSFCGPTIMHAFMQACGLVNDHDHDCFCYKEC